MNFTKRTLGSDTFGVIQFIVVIPLIIGLTIGSFLLGTWIGAIGAVFVLLLFLTSYAPFNKIYITETSISEKTLFRTISIPLKDIRQIGLLVLHNKNCTFLKEDNIKSTAMHIEIYILNYETVNIPEAIDNGKNIRFDYRADVWNFLKNNSDLQFSLKHGELIASKSKQYL